MNAVPGGLPSLDPERANARDARKRQFAPDATTIDGFRPAVAPRPAPPPRQVPAPARSGQSSTQSSQPPTRSPEASGRPEQSSTPPSQPATRPTQSSAQSSEDAGRPQHRASRAAAPANEVPATMTRTDMPVIRVRPAPTNTRLVLPVPPSDKEKYSYVRRHSWILLIGQVLAFPPLIYSQYLMMRVSPWFLIYAPFVIIGVITSLVSLIADWTGRGFDLAEHQRIVASWMPLWYPSVDVFLPICGEPLELLRNTWTHVAALRAAYNGKLTPYVLDDGANPDAKRLAREMGFAYAVRPDRGWYKKSGNLRYGVEISDGEFILLLDADFAPRPDMLAETLPYFTMFPDVGIVQTPQYFHITDDQTWVERGGGATQELFYRSIQMTRARKHGATCVGSCAVYRREALEANGGMSLAEHSEDLHTGFDLSQLGWRMRYLPIALSTGNCPDNIIAFLNQQYRWCSGTFSLLREAKFWKARLGLTTRFCYLSGLTYYMYTAIFTFVAPVLAISMLVFTPGIVSLKALLYIGPMLLYGGVLYPMWHRAPYRLEAWSVRALSGWAHAFALWDMLRGRLRGWQPSGSGAKRQDGRRRLWIGLIGWSLGSSLGWTLLGLWRMSTLNSFNFYAMFAFGLFQLVIVARILIQPQDGADS